MTGTRERGDSLVELLVAMAILGLAVSVLISGFGNLALISSKQRDAGRATTALATSAEWVKANCRSTACTSADLDAGVAQDVDVILDLTGPTTPSFASAPLKQYVVRATADSMSFTTVVVVRP